MQASPAPAQPTPAPAPPAPPGVTTRLLPPIAGAGPADVYRAMREQRSELAEQLEDLEEKRAELQQQIRQSSDGAKVGLEARMKEVDARISATDAKLAEANAAVANAAAVPGAVVPEPVQPRRTDPEEIVGIAATLLGVLLLPLVIAHARRIWKRAAVVIAPVPQEVRDQLDGLTHAVESIGIEVERIGEGQRFVTKVLAEQGARGLAGGTAGPNAIPVPGQGAEHARRS